MTMDTPLSEDDRTAILTGLYILAQRVPQNLEDIRRLLKTLEGTDKQLVVRDLSR